MTSDDLRHLVRTMAAEATGTVRVDENRLVPRIRRHRRRRLAITGLAGVVTTAAIAVGAYAVLPGPETTGTVATQEQTPTPSLPTKPGPTTGNDLPKCGSIADPRFPPTLPSGMEGLHLSELTFTKSPTGWTGSFRIEAPTDPRRLEGIAETTEFVVRQQRRMVGQAVLTATAEPRSTRPGVRVHVDLRGCAGPVPAGTIVLYGQLVPGKHPLTIFPIHLP
ncbi:hypothetical protein ACXC9Q_28410 [Kribbella sp. CWNU-51]